jgi:integrase
MGSGLLLTTRFGNPIDPRNVQRVFQARATKPDVPAIPVHASRRTCASLLVALNVHPRVATTILRHSKIAVTMDIYSHVSSTSTKEALKFIGNQFGEGVL